MTPPTPTEPTFTVADLDPYARRITVGVAYLGGLLALPMLFAYLADLRWDGLLVPLALAAALAVFLLLAYAFQARQLRLTADALVIERRLAPAWRIAYREISGVSPAAGLDDLARRRARWGLNAGVFGYLGPFSLAPYGRISLLATDLTRLVAVARPGHLPLLLSPHAPRAFIEAFNRARAEAATKALQGPPEAAS